MKEIVFDKNFTKHFVLRVARNPSLLKRYDKRYTSFFDGERGRPLDDHALEGRMAGKRAFSITGDVRVVYEETSDYIIFLDVGTHAQVYGT